MASCDACGSTIIFGGKQSGGYRFCNAKCEAKGGLVRVASQIPADQADAQARAIHAGNCPICRGPGPVDVHTAHQVWSALVVTSWKSSPNLCCKSCGRNKQLAAAGLSLVAGWWGFPWGLLMTPIQVGRNLAALAGPDPSAPSPKLQKIARLILAQQALAQAQPPPLPPAR